MSKLILFFLVSVNTSCGVKSIPTPLLPSISEDTPDQEFVEGLSLDEDEKETK